MASAALEAFIDETIEVSRKHNYHPTTFIRMRQDYQTIAAITRLVQSGDIQSGFKRLNALGLREWTIESAVVKFADEFSPEALECAKFRLSLAESLGHNT